MAQGEGSAVCLRGHASADLDYCSECGVRIGGAPSSEEKEKQSMEGAPAFTGEVCPDCATLREAPEIAFCEVCGFNFQTGAHGEIPLLTRPPAADGAGSSSEMHDAASATPASLTPEEPAPAPEDSTTVALEPVWQLLIEVDPALRQEGSPEPPVDFAPVCLTLKEPVNLIGRADAARGIFPEIALTADDAVSRRHALVQRAADGSGLLLRDIGASNGTRLNGVALEPMVDHLLKDGDAITLGHWTRLRVQHG